MFPGSTTNEPGNNIPRFRVFPNLGINSQVTPYDPFCIHLYIGFIICWPCFNSSSSWFLNGDNGIKTGRVLRELEIVICCWPFKNNMSGGLIGPSNPRFIRRMCLNNNLVTFLGATGGSPLLSCAQAPTKRSPTAIARSRSQQMWRRWDYRAS